MSTPAKATTGINAKVRDIIQGVLGDPGGFRLYLNSRDKDHEFEAGIEMGCALSEFVYSVLSEKGIDLHHLYLDRDYVRWKVSQGSKEQGEPLPEWGAAFSGMDADMGDDGISKYKPKKALSMLEEAVALAG